MREKIANVLFDNLYLVLGYKSKEEFFSDGTDRDYGCYECEETAQELKYIFSEKERFTKEQIVGIIKYYHLMCWHELVDDSIYEKIYNEIIK